VYPLEDVNGSGCHRLAERSITKSPSSLSSTARSHRRRKLRVYARQSSSRANSLSRRQRSHSSVAPALHSRKRSFSALCTCFRKSVVRFEYCVNILVCAMKACHEERRRTREFDLSGRFSTRAGVNRTRVGELQGCLKHAQVELCRVQAQDVAGINTHVPPTGYTGNPIINSHGCSVLAC
jgi:hypothetical protein